jgi:hypothetical protein
LTILIEEYGNTCRHPLFSVLASSFCRSIEADIGNNDQGCLPDHLLPSLRRSYVLQARRNESVHGCRSRVRAWLRGTRRVRSCSEKKSRSSSKIAQESHVPRAANNLLRTLEVVDGNMRRDVPNHSGLKRHFAIEQRLRTAYVEQPMSHGHIKPFCG